MTKLKKFEDGTLNTEGKDVVVIGGGDTAMDCVRTSIRQNAKSVKCLYRRDKENMPGSLREVTNAEEEGAEFVWLSSPKKFQGINKVENVITNKIILGEPDDSGRRKPEVQKNSDFSLKADIVIKALGFDPEDLPKLFGCDELQVTRWGTIKTDFDTMETNIPGVFAAGDIIRGASLVVWGIKDGRDAATSIKIFLERNELKKRKLLSEKIQKNLKILEQNHVYSKSMEHDACGVGLVASTEGKKSRKIVEYGIEALKAVWHRGAVDADGKTGDGAGIHIEISPDFFIEKIETKGHKHDNSEICIGMVFYPEIILMLKKVAKIIVEKELTQSNFKIYGWRQVPINTKVLGKKANNNRPEITQILFKYNDKSLIDKALERKLYETRRKIEKEIIKNNHEGFYICSLSSKSIIYKGMFLAEALSDFLY